MVTYRPAQKEDAGKIATLHARSWQQNYRDAFSDHFLDTEVFEDRHKAWNKRLGAPIGKSVYYGSRKRWNPDR